jgi:hypothetical protein
MLLYYCVMRPVGVLQEGYKEIHLPNSNELLTLRPRAYSLQA